MCTGGRKGFLRAAFKKMKDSMKVDKGDEGDDRRAGSGPGPAFEAALVSAFGKKDKEDVAQRHRQTIGKTGSAKGFQVLTNVDEDELTRQGSHQTRRELGGLWRQMVEGKVRR